VANDELIDRQRQKGSRILILLALAFWGMGIVNMGQAVQSYQNLALLAEWKPSLSPWVLLIFSLGWAAVWLAAGWELWRRRGWGRRLGLWAPPIYGIYSAGMILLFTRSPYARGRWVLVALGWAIASLMIGWLLTRARFRIQFSVTRGTSHNSIKGREQQSPYPFLKWLTDKLVPLVLIVLFSPVLMIIVLGMALDMLLYPADRGTWLYRERRTSRGKEFDLLKFRVLRQDVSDRAAGHARRYERDTANLTWAGRHILKKWYFDELPQLLNILRGDMSLVGPRPWPIHMFEKQVARGVVYRKLIRAGWTGPAQLQKGRPNPLNSEKLDLEYLERCRTWSGWQLCKYDLQVLKDTLRVMLEGRGLRY